MPMTTPIKHRKKLIEVALPLEELIQKRARGDSNTRPTD
jgi:hypothetical protein